ncbi:MAG: hypothetical protein C4318_05425 [Acidimicrobiia bacterium]
MSAERDHGSPPKNRYPTGVPFPTGRGFTMIALSALFFIVGILGSNYLATAVGAAGLAFCTGSAIATWDLIRRVDVRRDLTIRGQVGSPIPFRVEVVAERGAKGAVIAKDQNFGVHPVLLGISGESTDATWLLRLTQRGYWNHFRTMLATSVPAGLFIAKKEVVTEADVVIGPQTYHVDIPEGMGSVTWSGEVRTTPPRTGVGIDFLNIREYRPGDRVRRIHWRASARHDELFVKEMEHEGRLELVVAVETLSPRLYWVTESSSKYPSLPELWVTTPALPTTGLGDVWGERALVVAASLSLAALERGHTVYLLSGSQVMRRVRSREEVMDYWARTNFGPEFPTVPKLGSSPKRASTIFVSTPHTRPYFQALDESVFLVFTGAPEPVRNRSWYAEITDRLTVYPLHGRKAYGEGRLAG